jgi:hypothetical protein
MAPPVSGQRTGGRTQPRGVKIGDRPYLSLIDPAGRNKIFSVVAATKSTNVCLKGGIIQTRASQMNGIIYLVGLVVIVMAILSFLGLR